MSSRRQPRGLREHAADDSERRDITHAHTAGSSARSIAGTHAITGSHAAADSAAAADSRAGAVFASVADVGSVQA